MKHTDHDHPNTTAARAACRKRHAQVDAAIQAVRRNPQAAAKAASAKIDTYRASQTPHCEQCGRPNPGHDEGYTACCNELICYGTRSTPWAAGNFDGPEGFVGRQRATVHACCAHYATINAAHLNLDTAWRA